MTTTKTLSITWRDENYGQLSGYGAAFRTYDTADLSDAQLAKLHSAFRGSGFTWHQGRCAWIAEGERQAQDLVTKLQARGWTVQHEGCAPRCFA